MPLNLSKLGKVLKTLNRLETPATFNASLPVKLEVKKELNPITYLVKIGNKEVETKSDIPLAVGKKYFAQIKEFKNSVQITNLKEYPKILQTLDKITLPKEFSSLKKDEVLHHLANAKNKDEFLFFMNILIAFEKKIHHLIINEKRKALMQYKYEKNSLKFYAVFSNLGEIEGVITPTRLTICSPYDATIRLIELYKNEINLSVQTIKKEVKPIYDFSNSLLDLRV